MKKIILMVLAITLCTSQARAAARKTTGVFLGCTWANAGTFCGYKSQTGEEKDFVVQTNAGPAGNYKWFIGGKPVPTKKLNDDFEAPSLPVIDAFNPEKNPPTDSDNQYELGGEYRGCKMTLIQSRRTIIVKLTKENCQ